MKIAFFDAHRFERETFESANKAGNHELVYFEPRLTVQTASLAKGFGAVCSFVNDHLDSVTLQLLHDGGTRLIALRSAGFNHVDLLAAKRLGMTVVRVPEYSPHAVAEHAVTLVLALNRHIHRAYTRVREANFSLDGLVGFDLNLRTVGIIGTGKIGAIAARIFKCIGCEVLAYDIKVNPELERAGIQYRGLTEVFKRADILSLHVPLTPETRHLIDERAIGMMKRGVMVVNTGRGALIDTKALIDALKTGWVGAAGLDVYEEEEGVFFCDLSDRVLQDDLLARLLTFPNVIVTSHQGFLTHEALTNIAETTLANVSDFEHNRPLKNQVEYRESSL